MALESFKVRFIPTVAGAFGMLWAALTGKAVALTVSGPYRIEQEGSVLTIRHAPPPGDADNG